ncbi:MAG: hypothetical protein E7585_01855 [Ruminococcaceae bacterium]|nr:hypothetical protein [Oscillospiraceae bacterium]
MSKEVANWGFHEENEIMKGYIQKAFDDQQLYGDTEITDEQRKEFFIWLEWAIDEMTAAEALEYYYNN